MPSYWHLTSRRVPSEDCIHTVNTGFADERTRFLDPNLLGQGHVGQDHRLVGVAYDGQ